MKAVLRKIGRVKKRQAIKKAMAAVSVGWALKYGAINANADLFVDYGQYNQRLEAKYGYQKPVTVGDDEQSLIESQSVNSIRFKTGSGAVVEMRNQQNQKKEINVSSVQPSEALKPALEVRSGDLGKSGPGARAKADARRHKGSGSSIIPGANGFVPQIRSATILQIKRKSFG